VWKESAVVRRYEEPIEVRAAADEESDPGVPSAFVWRGRLYVVREVLDHWQERRAWWRDTPDGPPDRADRTPDRADRADRAPGRRAVSERQQAVVGAACERQVWRVEASAGRMAGSGVYDLGADPSPRQWRLLRVAD
jgi:hypothetical protein